MALFHHAFKHVLITVVLTLASARLAAQPLAYVKQYQQTVIALSDSFGIPAELIMGIALVESGAGTSQVCKILHNHFLLGGTTPIKYSGCHSNLELSR